MSTWISRQAKDIDDAYEADEDWWTPDFMSCKTGKVVSPPCVTPWFWCPPG